MVTCFVANAGPYSKFAATSSPALPGGLLRRRGGDERRGDFVRERFGRRGRREGNRDVGLELAGALEVLDVLGGDVERERGRALRARGGGGAREQDGRRGLFLLGLGLRHARGGAARARLPGRLRGCGLGDRAAGLGCQLAGAGRLHEQGDAAVLGALDGDAEFGRGERGQREASRARVDTKRRGGRATGNLQRRGEGVWETVGITEDQVAGGGDEGDGRAVLVERRVDSTPIGWDQRLRSRPQRVRACSRRRWITYRSPTVGNERKAPIGIRLGSTRSCRAEEVKAIVEPSGESASDSIEGVEPGLPELTPRVSSRVPALRVTPGPCSSGRHPARWTW